MSAYSYQTLEKDLAMKSARHQLPDIRSKNKPDSLQNLTLQLSLLEDDFKKTNQLVKLDIKGLTDLGLFRSQLDAFKEEIYQAADPEKIDEIVESYNYLFELKSDVNLKKNYTFVERIGEIFFLIGALGEIYDFTYGSSTIPFVLSWASMALGLFTRVFVGVKNSVNLQFKKLDKIEEQIQQPLYKIIDPEKLPNFKVSAHDYLHARVKFFKTNLTSMNCITLSYPTPINVLRLMLDCYHAIHNSGYEDIAEIKKMIDGCFAYLYCMNGGKLNTSQQALYKELFEDITPTNKTNRLTPMGSRNGLVM